MLPYKLEVTEDNDAVTAYAGLPLVVETLRILFTLAARIPSHAGSIVMKIGHAANALADLVASRLRLAALATPCLS
jgi:hypothetical protein